MRRLDIGHKAGFVPYQTLMSDKLCQFHPLQAVASSEKPLSNLALSRPTEALRGLVSFLQGLQGPTAARAALRAAHQGSAQGSAGSRGLMSTYNLGTAGTEIPLSLELFEH